MSNIFQTDEATFCFVKVSNLYVVTSTQINANITMVFAFLHKLVNVCSEYFKVYLFCFFPIELTKLKAIFCLLFEPINLS